MKIYIFRTYPRITEYQAAVRNENCVHNLPDATMERLARKRGGRNYFIFKKEKSSKLARE